MLLFIPNIITSVCKPLISLHRLITSLFRIHKITSHLPGLVSLSYPTLFIIFNITFLSLINFSSYVGLDIIFKSFTRASITKTDLLFITSYIFLSLIHVTPPILNLNTFSFTLILLYLLVEQFPFLSGRIHYSLLLLNFISSLCIFTYELISFLYSFHTVIILSTCYLLFSIFFSLLKCLFTLFFFSSPLPFK